jgi:hypothetical protein
MRTSWPGLLLRNQVQQVGCVNLGSISSHSHCCMVYSYRVIFVIFQKLVDCTGGNHNCKLGMVKVRTPEARDESNVVRINSEWHLRHKIVPIGPCISLCLRFY